MKNSLAKRLYHSFVCKYFSMRTFRGGWILTHFFYTDYKQHKGSICKIVKAHLKGWSYSDWQILGLTDKTYKSYLSTRDYCSLHPLNDSYSSWIDDKLTLKYILSGTKAGQYMPDYYYELMADGRIVGLMDLDSKYDNTVESIAQLLRDKHLLAFKLVKASLGVGFYRAEYKDGMYLMNGEEMDLNSFLKKVKSMIGYLVTEYLLPHPEFAKLCDKSVGCLRFLIGRKLDGSLVDIFSFIRFGTVKSGFVENYAAGGVLAILKNGVYSYGNILDMATEKNVVIDEHPDTGQPLRGTIPHWDEVKNAAHTVANVLPQMSYMGIDFCVTKDDRIKIIEINSLSSLDTFNFENSILETQAGEFFKERLIQKQRNNDRNKNI